MVMNRIQVYIGVEGFTLRISYCLSFRVYISGICGPAVNPKHLNPSLITKAPIYIYIYSSLIVPFKGTPGKEPYSNY